MEITKELLEGEKKIRIKVVCTVSKSKYSNEYLRAVCGVADSSNRYKSVRQCRAVANRAEKE